MRKEPGVNYANIFSMIMNWFALDLKIESDGDGDVDLIFISLRYFGRFLVI